MANEANQADHRDAGGKVSWPHPFSSVRGIKIANLPREISSGLTLAAGAEVTSQLKIERCSKVAGEVAYIATLALNEYFAGKWTPPVWMPSKGIKHCISSHGPDSMGHPSDGMNHQQGHMEGLMCHDDHTVG